MENKKIYYSLPGFLNRLNSALISLMESNPDWFRDNVVIDSMYGSFPGMIWNGGRVCGGDASEGYMAETIKRLNEKGISVRYTFTNCNITEEHFDDAYGNVALKIANELSGKFRNQYSDMVFNGVTVNVPEFWHYIKKHYSNLYRVWSTTREVKTTGEVNILSENSLIVLPYHMNNTSLIEDLQHPKKIELLCCESCIDRCPLRQEHYQVNSDRQMGKPQEKFSCPYTTSFFYEQTPLREHYISPEKIEEYYLPRGFDKFKISGRGESLVSVIEKYVIFLAKPQCRDIVRNHLLIDSMENTTLHI